MDEQRVEMAGLRAIAVGDATSAPLVVVLLHGFAMTPADLSPFAYSLGVPAWFVFPEGPLPAHPSGKAWWHIDPEQRAESMSRGPRDFATIYPPDLGDARARLSSFVDAVRERRADCPLVLGGFSQGGMLVSDLLVREGQRADAAVLLSTSRVALDDWTPHLREQPVRAMPVFVSHGRSDGDLAFSAGEALRDCLAGAGAEVTWRPFDQGHQIPLPVWRALRKFLVAQMPRPQP